MATRTAFISALLLAAAAAPAEASDAACEDAVKALYAAQFDRPSHRSKRSVDAFGSETHYDDIVMRQGVSISTVNGADSTLAYDRDAWTGPGPDGPWNPAPIMRGEDWLDKLKAEYDQYIANMTDIACLGAVEVEGVAYQRYRFTSKTDADATGFWYGGTHDYFTDPQTGLLMREETRHYTGAYGDDPEGYGLTVFDYDDSIVIEKPQ